MLATNIAYAAGPDDPKVIEVQARDRFAELSEQDWQEVFFDTGTGDWRNQWSLDGLKADVNNSEDGMNFRAGAVPDENAHHAVLWTSANGPACSPRGFHTGSPSSSREMNCS